METQNTLHTLLKKFYLLCISFLQRLNFISIIPQQQIIKVLSGYKIQIPYYVLYGISYHNVINANVGNLLSCVDKLFKFAILLIGCCLSVTKSNPDNFAKPIHFMFVIFPKRTKN